MELLYEGLILFGIVFIPNVLFSWWNYSRAKKYLFKVIESQQEPISPQETLEKKINRWEESPEDFDNRTKIIRERSKALADKFRGGEK